MISRMRTMLAAIMVCFWSFPILAQCHFVAEPAALTNWYRSEGWELPGVKNGKIIGPIKMIINDKHVDLPDRITVSRIVHPKNYRVSFPAAMFEEGGKTKTMQARTLSLNGLFRWEINGKPYAYSYDLWPDDVMCTFSVDLIDDKGDGIFRVMVTPGHIMQPQIIVPGNIEVPQPPALPDWAKKSTS